MDAAAQEKEQRRNKQENDTSAIDFDSLILLAWSQRAGWVGVAIKNLPSDSKMSLNAWQDKQFWSFSKDAKN